MLVFGDKNNSDAKWGRRSSAEKQETAKFNRGVGLSFLHVMMSFSRGTDKDFNFIENLKSGA